jgi:hypothetical protein
MRKKKVPKPPIRVEVAPVLPPAKPKPIRRIVTTFHPRRGYIKSEVIE